MYDNHATTKTDRVTTQNEKHFIANSIATITKLVPRRLYFDVQDLIASKRAKN